MGNSLLRFVKDEQPNGRGRLHWGRAGVDGAPFRGNQVPMGTEEELEEKLVKTLDANNRVFDLADPASNKAYVDLLTMIANGRAQLLHREHMKKKIKRRDPQTKAIVIETTIQVYVEWVMPYMELFD